MLQLIKVNHKRDLDIEKLINESKAEGYNFVETIQYEYERGINQYQNPNETLLIAMNEYGIILGIAGIQPDPYLNDDRIGRVRHFYVSSGYRRLGVGRSLINALLEFSKDHYDRVRLRTTNPIANEFYEEVGFMPTQEADATHTISL